MIDENLASIFRKYRRIGYPAGRALLSARAAIHDSKVRPPLPVDSSPGAGAPSKNGLRWLENPAAAGLRFVGYADEIADRAVDHTGWFTDEFQDSRYRGAVWQVSGKDGRARFLAGYVEFEGKRPTNRDSARIDCSEIYSEPDESDGKREAALAADGIAESEAENAREYNEAWQAGSHVELTRSGDLAQNARDIRARIAEFRKVQKAFSEGNSVLKAHKVPPLDFELVRAALLPVIRMELDKRENIRREIAELIDQYDSGASRAAFRDGAGM